MEIEYAAVDHNYLAECTENINLALKKCIQNCMGTERMMNARFGASIEEILPITQACDGDFLTYLLRPKQSEYSAQHGLSVSGRIKGN